MKHFISKLPTKKAKLEESTKPAEQKIPGEEFPETTGCLMIFDGVEA